MKKFAATLIGLATVGMLFTTAATSEATISKPRPDTATASDKPKQAPTAAFVPKRSQRAATSAAAEPDGKFWVWEHWYFSGRGCGYFGNWQDYRNSGSNCGDMDNIASSVQNRGYIETFDDVRMHRDYVYSGPSMCLGVGDQWADLNLGWEVFSNGEFANDKISSHIWANSCP